MKDRVPRYPGRRRLTRVDTGETFLADVAMADEPVEPGTTLNKAALMTDMTEQALFGGVANRTVNDALARLTAHDITFIDYCTEPPIPTVVANMTGDSHTRAGSIGNYALFMSGSTLTAYDSTFTKIIPTQLSVQRSNPAIASNGNYALIAGGAVSGVTKDTVDAYDSSLTRISAPALSAARNPTIAIPIGQYALFTGGYATYVYAGDSYYKAEVDAYDASLTRTSPSSGFQRNSPAAAVVGNYALIAGGNNSSGTALNSVEAYSETLTRYGPEGLAAVASSLGGASTTHHALFAGGMYYSGGYHYARSVVNVYDSTLTRTTGTSLSTERAVSNSGSIAGYALFFGGADDRFADAYDPALTLLKVTGTGTRGIAANVGDYLLSGGSTMAAITVKASADIFVPAYSKYKLNSDTEDFTLIDKTIRYTDYVNGYIKRPPITLSGLHTI